MLCKKCKKELPKGETTCPICGENNADEILQKEPLYNTVPIWKVIVLLVLSFGAYTVVWAYNLWKQGQKKYDKKISPFWRAIFISITSFKLFPLIDDYLTNPPKADVEDTDGRVKEDPIEGFGSKTIPAIGFALIYLISTGVAKSLDKIASYSQNFTVADLFSIIFSIIALVPIVIIQIKINDVNCKYNIQAKNDIWTWKTTVFVAIWLLFIITLTILPAVLFV